MIWIESLQNKTLKRIMGLKQKKQREKEGVFLAEGLRFVKEIPLDWEVEHFIVSKRFFEENSLSQFERKANIIYVEDKVFPFLSETEHSQGILAVCRQKKYEMEQIVNIENGFFLLAEELNDPGNLGTIIRTADACGVQGIFLSKGSVDLYNGKTLRSTMGSIFHVPVFHECDFPQLIRTMKRKEIRIYAAHLKGAEVPYYLNLKQSCAFLIGNEARGLREETAELADCAVKIPMPGQAESLNASIAAGVLLYEAVRQRNFEG